MVLNAFSKLRSLRCNTHEASPDGPHVGDVAPTLVEGVAQAPAQRQPGPVEQSSADSPRHDFDLLNLRIITRSSEKHIYI